MGRSRVEKTIGYMKKDFKHLLVFPDAKYMGGWLEELSAITNENIRLVSRYHDCVMLYSEHEDYVGYAFLNFSMN